MIYLIIILMMINQGCSKLKTKPIPEVKKKIVQTLNEGDKAPFACTCIDKDHVKALLKEATND